jgi:hypothetical protein
MHCGRAPLAGNGTATGPGMVGPSDIPKLHSAGDGRARWRNVEPLDGKRVAVAFKRSP